jgi:hypothetical protein
LRRARQRLVNGPAKPARPQGLRIERG